MPEKIVALLARLIKRTPADVHVILAAGPIRLVKVLVTGDMEKMASLFEKNGLAVEMTPLEREPSAQEDGKAAELTGQTGTARPSAWARSATDWKKGDVIEGIYEIFGSAAGGMGKVYFVFHRLWKMMLAIKTPHVSSVKSETRLLRYLREAELWVDLGVHPNIATCFYARVIDGLPRLFIEYVDGGTLETWRKSKRHVDLYALTDLMLQFCYGMMYAEEQGMIHRDIKPANCLISSEKILKITDFGLVKRIDEPSSRTEPENGLTETSQPTDTSLTLYEGGIMGSPRYMAPERFTKKGSEDIRSDIYSFGIMLYELLLGTMPFKFPGELSLPVMVRSHLSAKPVDPLSIRPDLPRPVAELLLTCLEKKPENRYPSFSDVSRALEAVSLAARPDRKPRARPNLVELKADSLNNQGVSQLDLRREDEAMRLFEDAHSANTEHLEAVYNLHILRWKRCEISDREVIGRMESLKIETRETPPYKHYMGLISLQRGDPASGVTLLRKACRDGAYYRERWSEFDGDPGKFVHELAFVPIAEQASFAGHLKKVLSLSFAPDPRRAFSIGEDRSIRIWDVGTGRCLKNLRTFTLVPVAGAFSPNGRFAVTCYGDAFKTMDLWDLDEGKLLRRHQGTAVFGVSFSADSEFVAANGRNGRVLVLDASLEKVIWGSEDLERQTSSIAFVNAGQTFATGGEDGSLTLRHLGNKEEIYRIACHRGPVSSLEASGDGTLILSGGADESVYLWDASCGEQLQRFSGHRARVIGLRFLSDGKYVVSASADGEIKIWDASRGRCYRTVVVPQEELTACAVSADGKRLLSGGARGAVRHWSLDTRWFSDDFLEPALCRPRTFKELSSLHDSFQASVDDFNSAWRKGQRHDALQAFERLRGLPGFCWSREAILIRNVLWTASRRGRMKSCSFIRSFYGHKDGVNTVEAGSDSLILLTASADGTARLWDVVTGRCLRRFNVEAPVHRAVFLPGLKGVLTLSADGVLRWWGQDGSIIREIPDVVPPMATEPGGKSVLAMSPTNQPIRIALETGDRTELAALPQDTPFICFSEDLKSAYNVRDGRRIQRWCVPTSRNEGAFRDLGLAISALHPSASGDKVVAGLETGEITVYIVNSGMNVTTLRGHRAPVRTVTTGPDPDTWLTGSDDCSLRLWDLKAERCMQVLEGHSSPVTAACLFPNSSLIASGGSDGTVRLWGVEWEFAISECEQW